MSVLRAVRTASPECCVGTEEVRGFGRLWLKDEPESLARFEKVLGTSGVHSRHFAIPPKSILDLPGGEFRAALFESEARKLGGASARAALSGIDPKSVGTSIFTSCSVPSIPSVDALFVEDLELRRDVRRIPVYQHGCVGGAFGLSLASKLCAPRSSVLITSVELCSLVFHRNDIGGSSVIAAAIFGDGAASALVDAEGEGLTIAASQSFLLPNTRDFMGYDIFDEGAYLRLRSDLPHALAESAPLLVGNFLKANGLTAEEVPFWLFHPGGQKILSFLEDKFSLKRDQTKWAWQVLSNFGNMSSATILFVLSEFMREAPYSKGDNVLLMGVGPGLTIELILFRCDA